MNWQKMETAPNDQTPPNDQPPLNPYTTRDDTIGYVPEEPNSKENPIKAVEKPEEVDKKVNNLWYDKKSARK